MKKLLLLLFILISFCGFSQFYKDQYLKTKSSVAEDDIDEVIEYVEKTYNVTAKRVGNDPSIQIYYLEDDEGYFFNMIIYYYDGYTKNINVDGSETRTGYKFSSVNMPFYHGEKILKSKEIKSRGDAIYNQFVAELTSVYEPSADSSYWYGNYKKNLKKCTSASECDSIRIKFDMFKKFFETVKISYQPYETKVHDTNIIHVNGNDEYVIKKEDGYEIIIRLERNGDKTSLYIEDTKLGIPSRISDTRIAEYNNGEICSK